MAEYDRFRSFAERYVIERASTFTRGNERDEAWEAILDAKTVYRSIELVSHDAEPVPVATQAQNSGIGSASHMGSTAAHMGPQGPQGPQGPVAGPVTPPLQPIYRRGGQGPSKPLNQTPPPGPLSDPSTLQKLHQRLMGAIGKGP